MNLLTHDVYFQFWFQVSLSHLPYVFMCRGIKARCFNGAFEIYYGLKRLTVTIVLMNWFQVVQLVLLHFLSSWCLSCEILTLVSLQFFICSLFCRTWLLAWLVCRCSSLFPEWRSEALCPASNTVLHFWFYLAEYRYWSLDSVNSECTHSDRIPVVAVIGRCLRFPWAIVNLSCCDVPSIICWIM